MATREKRHLSLVEPVVEQSPEEELDWVTVKLRELKIRMDEDKKTYDKLRNRFFELLTAVTGKSGKVSWVGRDGYVYGRTVAMKGAGKIDVEALVAAEPEIAEQVTDLVRVINDDKVLDYLDEHPEKTRTIQRFMSDGTPEVRMAPITKAKTDE